MGSSPSLQSGRLSQRARWGPASDRRATSTLASTHHPPSPYARPVGVEAFAAASCECARAAGGAGGCEVLGVSCRQPPSAKQGAGANGKRAPPHSAAHLQTQASCPPPCSTRNPGANPSTSWAGLFTFSGGELTTGRKAGVAQGGLAGSRASKPPCISERLGPDFDCIRAWHMTLDGAHQCAGPNGNGVSEKLGANQWTFVPNDPAQARVSCL